MGLFDLPFELQEQIYGHMAPWTMQQLCLTDRHGYEQSLPHLYRHIRIRTKRHFKNLKDVSPYLLATMRGNTRALTLTCTQTGHHWLLSDAMVAWCQLSVPLVSKLTLRDFPLLDVDALALFARHLPRLDTLHLGYCTLIVQDQHEPLIPMLPDDQRQTSMYQLPDQYYHHDPFHTHHTASIFDAVQPSSRRRSSSFSLPCIVSPSKPQLPGLIRIELAWTDFSATSIARLWECVPHIKQVHLGANHNRIAEANDACVASLSTHCHAIQHLTVALQQIQPDTLASCLDHYASQLISLQLHSQDWTVLKRIEHVQLASLALHGQAHRPLQPPPAPPIVPAPALSIFNNNARNKPHTKPARHPNWAALLGIVRQCRRLKVSALDWSLSDLPPLIRQQVHPATAHDAVILDERLLDEIRALYL
ncbi:hypothetical protein BC940DRAFT_290559 [Gongronella butleri]|nr:hypothetical protein BC940DRAFT_290559 [Gongronella butleri]